MDQVELNGLNATQKAALAKMESGGELRDVIGLGTADVETIHAIGMNFLTQGKYEQAEPMLKFACLYAHGQVRYWMALADCRQKQKNYADALDTYGMAWSLDRSDAWPLIHMAVCCLAVGEKDDAAKFLKVASVALEEKPNESAKQRIAALQQAL